MIMSPRRFCCRLREAYGAMKIAAEAMTAPQMNVGLVRMPPSRRLGLGLVGESSSSLSLSYDCLRPPRACR